MLSNVTQTIQSLILAVTMLISHIGCAFYAPAAKKVDALEAKTGGFLFGVCHPADGEYDRLHDVGFGWVRFDIPYPFNPDGSLRGDYIAFKQRCKGYDDHGLKVMAITPYPKDYINIGGFFPTAPEHQQKTKDIAVFLLNDLRDVIGGIQVTNKMGIETFTYPLTMEEASLFVGIQLEALNGVKGDIIVGYNTAGMSYDFHKSLKPYFKYCDYVGLDFYLSGNAHDYVKRMRKIYRLTKCPILIQEFGYKSGGKAKTQAEKTAILQQYGYASEDEARADIVNFVAQLPPAFQTRIKEKSADPSGWGDAVFADYKDHFYRENSGSLFLDCEHTPEGQAQYFAQLMPELLREPYLAGLTVYCWRDSGACWFCGFPDCPHETCWGLTDMQGNAKPAYSAVKQVIADYNHAHAAK